MSTRVSVAVPSYNHARFVGAAVESVLSQDVDGLEVVVVDDGSKDDSLEVLAGIRDPRLRVVAQENRGAHIAIDRALRESTGAVLAILNSDDRFLPGRLREALAVLDDAPDVGLVGSWLEVVDAEGRPIAVKEGFANLDPWPVPEPARTFKAEGDLRLPLLMQNYWATTSNYVFPRRSYERHGPMRPLRFAHDWDFALRVQRAERAHLIPRPLLQYRVHGSNTIRTDRAAMVYEVCWMMAVHLPRYVADGFWDTDLARRTDQLLQSIHVYRCDSVFWGMLLQVHFGPVGREEALLDPADASRQLYLDEIRGRLEADSETPAAPPVAGEAAALGRKLLRLLGARR